MLIVATKGCLQACIICVATLILRQGEGEDSHSRNGNLGDVPPSSLLDPKRVQLC
jgi:hypothetical protein